MKAIYMCMALWRNEMKRIKCLVILIMVFIAPLLFAEDMEKPMVIRTRIPEDYAVSYPSGVMRMDHLVFELQLETGTEALIENNGMFSLSFLESGVSALELSLLYYGNQSEEYSALIHVNPGDGWVGKMGNRSIPMNVVFKAPEYEEEGITVKEVGKGVIEMSVLPQGPRNGVEFASLLFEWSVDDNAWAGEYEAIVNISLEAI